MRKLFYALNHTSCILTTIAKNWTLRPYLDSAHRIEEGINCFGYWYILCVVQFIPSAIRPVPHTEDLPVPVPLQHYILDSDDEPTEKREKTPQPSTPTNADFTADILSNEFHRITQEELNDLIRDLDLPKCKAELLGSRLQQSNLLKGNVRISVYCKRYEDLVPPFKMERGLVACTDIDGLMQTLNINHIPLDWRLFIDSSKLSLKAVLLHNGNTLHFIPVGHSVHNKESHENIKILMEAINYDKFKWKICGDLKVIALLLGLQQGFTKYCCFICEWDSRARSFHYSRKDWPARKSLLNLRIIREAQTWNLWCSEEDSTHLCALQSVYRWEGVEGDRR